ncbi:MAG: hypothetical protein ABW321_20485, partial [Polyangiales bacterium]
MQRPGLGSTIWGFLAAASLLACLSCRDQTVRPQRDQRRAEPLGAVDVVSRVDGQIIRASEVDQLARVGALSPGQALKRLQDERLLSEEAERRGYAGQMETVQVARQALVQALLAEDVEAEPITEAELNAAYHAEHARFSAPELRRATHVLAQLPPQPTAAQEQAARTFIEQAIERLRPPSQRTEVL